MSMSMGMGMGMSISQSQSLSQKQTMTQRVSVTMPQTNWSLVDAFDEDRAREFNYPLAIKRQRLPSYGQLSHEEQMRLVERLNAVFRFVYTRGENEETGRPSGYYRIPLMRDRNVMEDLDSIKQKITKAEYERSQAILECGWPRAFGRQSRL